MVFITEGARGCKVKLEDGIHNLQGLLRVSLKDRRQEVAALMTAAHLECLQGWVRIAIQADKSFRQIIEAPTREEEHKKHLERQEKKASEQKSMPASASSATPTIKK
ncbi:MAG TPA: hypothetical protein VIP27_08440 [Variovorax sp.]